MQLNEYPSATIGKIATRLAPNIPWLGLLKWPPDVFGIVAFLLQKSGSYIEIVRDWPPAQEAPAWAEEMRRIGKTWRKSCITGAAAPAEVRKWWSDIRKNFDLRLRELSLKPALISSLAQVLAAADEACFGVGIQPGPGDRAFDAFDNRASRILHKSYTLNSSTLAENVDPSLFRVLPKLHTPQSGITIRSLSHHLALCAAGEVNPKWVFHPPSSDETKFGLNLLLVPWPERISLLDFSAVLTPAGLRNMPPNMGFFSYEQSSDYSWPSAKFKKLIQNAIGQVGAIDGVILPELALKSQSDFDQAYSDLADISKRAFLIAGVGGKATSSSFNLNRLRYQAPITAPSLKVNYEQDKHHRWRLDESQIRQYGLPHRLDPYTVWWENTDVRERQVHFFAMAPWLTMCALICEDLARQDPVADVLRCVGPNLIIALLMDGPQLQRRWSGRYATIFADDPGSSVLCLTSLGMAMHSKPLEPSTSIQPRRIVGLWKDADAAAREIELPDDAEAVVISLNRVYRNEWSADGRDDGGSTAYLTFGRLHYVQSK